ncbi:adenylate/guanylate cyclase domain-containing protein [Tumidithrix helvetica PCC 7403]|uniref:FHA domain-containing protein n=1 Tax=Tumidithrix helvetica TaxID=3457545 RepID=UPI003CA0E1D3
MELSSQPHLKIHYADGDLTFPLVNATSWTFGRGEENTVVLKDKWASRNHAVIQIMESGNFYLIDLGSLNGSFVNDRRVSIPIVLQSGDRITLGMTDMELVCPPNRPSPDVTAGAKQRSTIMLHQRRMISVLVIDIRNFTKLTRQLEEQVLSQVIGTWFGKAGQIIKQYGSGVDKYIGDAVMAVWVHNTIRGTDKVVPQEMLRVFQALHALYKVSDQLNHQFDLPFPLRFGAGVNTGNAIVGQMGAGDRPEYTALGDTVNAAFRLESATKELGLDIALGETTFEQSPQAMALLPFQQHSVMLKGYDAATTTYAGTFAQLESFLEKVQGQVDSSTGE